MERTSVKVSHVKWSTPMKCVKLRCSIIAVWISMFSIRVGRTSESVKREPLHKGRSNFDYARYATAVGVVTITSTLLYYRILWGGEKHQWKMRNCGVASFCTSFVRRCSSVKLWTIREHTSNVAGLWSLGQQQHKSHEPRPRPAAFGIFSTTWWKTAV